jgi:predicted HTH transcriptional regulator
MLSASKVLDLISKGESLTVEFKQRFSTFEKIAKEMIAFANTRGGCLLIGVDDDKSIYGIESEKSDAGLIADSALSYCEPAVEYSTEFVELKGKEILAVLIPESKRKPHRIRDNKSSLDLNSAQVYVRVNDKSVLASKELIKLLQTNSAGSSLKNYTVGKPERIVFDYLDRNETISVKELGKHANISDRRASRTLIKLVRANLLLIHQKENGESFFTYRG